MEDKNIIIERMKEAELWTEAVIIASRGDTLSPENPIIATAFTAVPHANAVIISAPPYAFAVGNIAKKIPAVLDDMAQIIGPSAKVTTVAKIAKALKGRQACLVKGLGVVACGRTLDEAFTGTLVLEKGAKTFIECSALGGTKPINKLEAGLMHYIYKKKYSKLDQDKKMAEHAGQAVASAVDTNVGEAPCPPQDYIEERQLIKDSGVRLIKEKLVQGTWGNISVRLDENHMLVTPSGLDYERLTPADMVKVNINTLEYEGELKPTSEKKLHAKILRDRSDINVVIHSHPSYCCSVASARREMPIISDEMARLVGGTARSAPYALPGTKKMTKGTAEALHGRNACFMSNHGVVACAPDMEGAFLTCRIMEESAKAFIEAEALRLTGAETYSPELIIDLFKTQAKSK